MLTVTNKTPIKLTIGCAVGIVVFLLGVQPWAIAQVQGVVAAEFRTAGISQMITAREARESARP